MSGASGPEMGNKGKAGVLGKIVALLGIVLGLLVGWPLICNQWGSYLLVRQQRAMVEGHTRRAEAAMKSGENNLAMMAMSYAARAFDQDPVMEKLNIVMHMRQGAEQPGSLTGPRLHEQAYLLIWAEEEGLGESWLRLTLRANLLAAQGKRKEAIAGLREAIKLSNESALPHFLLGDLLRVEERYDEAEAMLRKAIELDAGHEAARLDLASILLRTKRPVDAETILRPLASSVSPVVQGLTGIALAQQRKTEEALPFLQRSFSLDPQQVEVAAQLGQTLLMLRRGAEAIRAFEAAHRLQQTPESLLQLARAQRATGENRKALENLKLLLRDNPNHMSGRMEYAALLEELGNQDDALSLYREVERGLIGIEGGEQLLGEVKRRISAIGSGSEADPVPDARPAPRRSGLR
ncbi:MAG: tetratricopeptide repeat protein [Deltaproteobacteria bacterium]|nr:tetratricopeptide repeat protein [Deltaproteobacteria bacterium]